MHAMELKEMTNIKYKTIKLWYKTDRWVLIDSKRQPIRQSSNRHHYGFMCGNCSDSITYYWHTIRRPATCVLQAVSHLLSFCNFVLSWPTTFLHGTICFYILVLCVSAVEVQPLVRRLSPLTGCGSFRMHSPSWRLTRRKFVRLPFLGGSRDAFHTKINLMMLLQFYWKPSWCCSWLLFNAQIFARAEWKHRLHCFSFLWGHACDARTGKNVLPHKDW